MISREEIEHLAELSRLKLTAEEVTAFAKDFESILAYVGQVSAAAVGDADAEEEVPAIRNVMREDAPVPCAVGGSREALIGAFPHREGDYLLVRKVIDKKK